MGGGKVKTMPRRSRSCKHARAPSPQCTINTVPSAVTVSFHAKLIRAPKGLNHVMVREYSGVSLFSEEPSASTADHIDRDLTKGKAPPRYILQIPHYILLAGRGGEKSTGKPAAALGPPLIPAPLSHRIWRIFRRIYKSTYGGYIRQRYYNNSGIND